MIGTEDGYWFSLTCVDAAGFVVMEIHQYGDTLTEEALVPDAAVVNIFDTYVMSDREQRWTP